VKFPYFKIKEAFDETRDSFSWGSGSDKLTSTAKLLGKSVANVGMLVAEVGVEVIKMAPEIAGKTAKQSLDKNSHVMSEEQIERAREISRKGDEARELRLEKEREERKELAKKEERKLAEKENMHRNR
jgi:hypothetical protein